MEIPLQVTKRHTKAKKPTPITFPTPFPLIEKQAFFKKPAERPSSGVFQKYRRQYQIV
jgi:hypothetical protein